MRVRLEDWILYEKEPENWIPGEGIHIDCLFGVRKDAGLFDALKVIKRARTIQRKAGRHSRLALHIEGVWHNSIGFKKMMYPPLLYVERSSHPMILSDGFPEVSSFLKQNLYRYVEKVITLCGIRHSFDLKCLERYDYECQTILLEIVFP